jgi:hypothetical protein
MANSCKALDPGDSELITKEVFGGKTRIELCSAIYLRGTRDMVITTANVRI